MPQSLLVKGFRFSGIAAGIKQSKSLDLALIYSEVPARVVGSFTTSRAQAAPVQLSLKNIRSGLCSAVIVNSGNANACSGARGMKDARSMVRATARALQVPEEWVQVCSTGKIGVPLPMGRILKKIPEAVGALSPAGFLQSAKAILTTDISEKIASAEGRAGNKKYRILGFAKGAGMIEPNMKASAALRATRAAGISSGARKRAPAVGHATMLAYILTDAALDRSFLKSAFREAVEETFNRVSVDGDMSTNDTALLLANGLAGNAPIRSGGRDAREFLRHLKAVMKSLALQMVVDGEGATKCVRIEIRGAKTDSDARKMAYTIANSLLVKTSFFGQDPNWGRVLAAAARSGALFDPDRADIFYGPVCVARRGVSTGPLKDAQAKKAMKKRDLTVILDAHAGKGRFWMYTSDLTLDYVKLNSCYRT